MRIRISNKFFVVLGLLFMSGSVWAAGGYKSSAALESDYEVMHWNGGTLMVGTLTGVAEIYGSTSSLITNGSVMINCGTRILTSGSDLDLISNCIQRDMSGNEFYTVAERKAGTADVGGGGAGVQKIVGGTGKYAGVTGNCTYAVKFLEAPWITVESTCSLD